jgi:hypothetical protein
MGVKYAPNASVWVSCSVAASTGSSRASRAGQMAVIRFAAKRCRFRKSSVKDNRGSLAANLSSPSDKVRDSACPGRALHCCGRLVGLKFMKMIPSHNVASLSINFFFYESCEEAVEQTLFSLVMTRNVAI